MENMKVLVTGAEGQLGDAVCRELSARQVAFLGMGHRELDVTDRDAVRGCIRQYRPDALIHCAAYTQVDKAEEEAEKCRAVNVLGAENAAVACRESGAKMLYISTDYIFDGEGSGAYGIDTPPHPINVYGSSKLAGEWAVKQQTERFFIVRTSWMFSAQGRNFVRAILKGSEGKDEIRVVEDQVGSPTYAADLARLLCDMAASERYGVYHAANEGFCSRREFAQEILRCAGRETRVAGISSAEYPAPARRPLNSRLCTAGLAEAGFKRLPPWRQALERCLREEETGR